MDKWEDKTTNQIQSDVKNMEFEYASIKEKLIELYDKMTYMEELYSEANNELLKRMKGRSDGSK